MRRILSLTLYHHICWFKWSDFSGNKLLICLIPNPQLPRSANQSILDIESTYLISALRN